MRLLLDSHAVIWWLMDEGKLSPETLRTINDPEHTLFLSAVTAWEIAIKKAAGKLTTPDDLVEQLRRNAIHELPITIEHATAAGQLPLHHKDPFDRMLIAQAMLEDLTLITRDRNIARYAVQVLPA